MLINLENSLEEKKKSDHLHQYTLSQKLSIS